MKAVELVRCQHGDFYRIPVPAVTECDKRKSFVCIKVTAVEGELVTPTGAAIVAAIRTNASEEFEIKKIGIGAGKRRYECPGILRAMIIS